MLQKPAEPQIPKKKKKKSSKPKADGDDSGVEVYFREEEDEGEEVKRDSAQVSWTSDTIFCFWYIFRPPQLENIIGVFLPLQVSSSSTGPSRLQVAAGFSWDVGLSSLKPVLEAKDGESSDGEEQDGNEKVRRSKGIRQGAVYITSAFSCFCEFWLDFFFSNLLTLSGPVMWIKRKIMSNLLVILLMKVFAVVKSLRILKFQLVTFQGLESAGCSICPLL